MLENIAKSKVNFKSKIIITTTDVFAVFSSHSPKIHKQNYGHLNVCYSPYIHNLILFSLLPFGEIKVWKHFYSKNSSNNLLIVFKPLFLELPFVETEY